MTVIISVVVFSIMLMMSATSAVTIKLTSDQERSAQALAAAESGVDTLRASFLNGDTCRHEGTVDRTPIVYDFAIHNARVNDAMPSVPTTADSYGAVAGCPTMMSTHVLIEVTGRSGSSTKTVTQVFEYNGGVFNPEAVSHAELPLPVFVDSSYDDEPYSDDSEHYDN